MAVTWAATGVTEGVSSSGKRTKTATLTPTGTYTTGGDALPLAALGLKRVTALYQRGLGGFVDPGYSVDLAGTLTAPLIRLFETNNTQMAGSTSITGRAFVAYVEGYE